MHIKQLEKKIEIFHNSVTACLECIIANTILETNFKKNQGITDYKLPDGLYKQVLTRQKIILIQYLHNIFDVKGFDLKHFFSEIKTFLSPEMITYFDLAQNLYSEIKKDVVLVRNNIGSHIAYKSSGHELAVNSLKNISAEVVDILLAILRLISQSLRKKFGIGLSFTEDVQNREALILEEIRRKTELFQDNKWESSISYINGTVTVILISEYYIKGIKPFYDIKTDQAFFMK